MDTIYALATARGKAGVAVIRVSGPDAFPVSERLCGRLPPLRQAGLRSLRGIDGQLLDEALVLRFPEGGSFTGEDVVELHLHGSRAVVSAVLSELGAQPELRLADPGEFTRRALENDRLDLTQVEGLADLIDAETEVQRRQALRTMSGALSKIVDGWRASLIRAAALIEATIDFADEDVPVDVLPEVRELVVTTHRQLEAEIGRSRIGERIRDGFEVALVGPPNAGKSTLLNALAGREAALTSSIAGTTRDVIEVRMDLQGLPVTFLDMAGLRDSEDELEAMGVALARRRSEAADLRIFLLDLPTAQPAGTPEADDIVIVGKGDLHPEVLASVSGATGQGLDLLITQVVKVLEERSAVSVTATHARHRQALSEGASALAAVIAALDRGEDAEIVAEDLRSALRSLDSLLGRVDVEHLLGEIFSSFCIGK